MLNPPFKLATSGSTAPAFASYQQAGCCEEPAAAVDELPLGRTRLVQLNQHLHCSVLGTCMGTAELRKVAGNFIDVKGRSDLDVHHDAVVLASQGAAAKTLHKALDQRHAAVLGRFAKVRGAEALLCLWEESLAQGEIPGAYWAVLTHRDVTTELRNRAFGDVHMLSHLVGAANRADIRRLVALEQENAELRERLDRHLLRSQELMEERDQTVTQLQAGLVDAQGRLASAQALNLQMVSEGAGFSDRVAESALVAIQTERRERAEHTSACALEEVARLQQEMELLHRHSDMLGTELAAAEIQLRELSDPGEGASSASPKSSHLSEQLRGRRILYVGGRPSSTPAIRGLVVRHGGEFQRHGGGAEDRKGLLASAVAAADLVVFPVDCIDHDSAGTLKRLCVRQGIPFIPMRKASVTSFAAALSGQPASAE